MNNYGAGVLAAGKARTRRISNAICNERATPPAAKGTSQNCSCYSFVTLKVGHLLVPGQAKIFVALDLGYFAEQGLDVELVEFSNSADGLDTSFYKRALDKLAAANPGDPFWQAHERDFAQRDVAPGATKP